MKNIKGSLSITVLMAALAVTPVLYAKGYVGGSYGGAYYEDLCDSVSGTTGATCDDSDYGYKIFGGARLSPNLALEASYMDMGEATASNTIFFMRAIMNL